MHCFPPVDYCACKDSPGWSKQPTVLRHRKNCWQTGIVKYSKIHVLHTLQGVILPPSKKKKLLIHTSKGHNLYEQTRSWAIWFEQTRKIAMDICQQSPSAYIDCRTIGPVRGTLREKQINPWVILKGGGNIEAFCVMTFFVTDWNKIHEFITFRLKCVNMMK